MSTALDLETTQAIATNVELAKTKLLASQGIAPDDWSAAVKYLDDFINRNRENFEDNKFGSLPSVIGSYLGEALVHTYGGQWIKDENGIGVSLNGGVTAFPINRALKQFTDGSRDSINSFFTSIPSLTQRYQDGAT